MPSVLKVEGAKQLRATLKKAGVDLGDLKAAHLEAAQIAERGADARAPRLSGRLAGTLRSSGTRTAGIVRAGRASVPWAGPVHWGWPGHNIKANPFISEGAQATESTWIDVYQQALDHAIDQVKGI